jgi:hypothetical protein
MRQAHVGGWFPSKSRRMASQHRHELSADRAVTEFLGPGPRRPAILSAVSLFNNVQSSKLGAFASGIVSF